MNLVMAHQLACVQAQRTWWDMGFPVRRQTELSASVVQTAANAASVRNFAAVKTEQGRFPAAS